MKPVPGGYVLEAELTRNWFELPAQRGLAGYGLARALRILLDVLSGLAALHDTKTEAGAGFVHGEVVPAMLRVDRQGCGRLVPLAPWHRLEVGVALATERQGHVAPERLLGDAIDQRADVFSCGVLLWEALAGRRLFEAESIDGIVMRLMGGKVQLPELPPELTWAAPLKSVAMCALSVDPAQRFGDCAELASAIEECVLDHIATHEEVAAFFGARERTSMLPPALPSPAVSHKSSLSALVAPALVREEPRASAAPSADAVPDTHASSSASTLSGPWSRRLLAGGLLFVLGALTWGLFTRPSVGSGQHSESGVPNGVDLRRPPQPSQALGAHSAAPKPSAEPAPAVSATTEAPPSVPHPDAAPGRTHRAGSRPMPGRGPMHPRVSKPAPARDEAADQYGI